MNIQSITDYISEDNRICMEIYEVLLQDYKNSLKKFPREINVIGIFFIEILKLLTGLILRKREIENNLVIKDNLHKELHTWPYVGYRDLIHGLDPDKKRYGRFLNKKRNMKQVTAEMATGVRSIWGSSRTTIGIINTGLDKDIFKACLKSNKRIKFMNYFMQDFFVPSLNEQISYLLLCLEELNDRIGLPINIQTLGEIISRHIKSMVKEGDVVPIDIDILVCGSENEFHNRILSAIAKYQKKHVICVTHGEGFGLLDEPLHGIGEQSFADAILGYGPFTLKNRASYRFLNDELLSNFYLPSSSEVAMQNHSSCKIKSLNISSNTKVYYLPTSLSGANYRYGPYRDLPDLLYLNWHRKIVSYFDNIIIKAHPKEKHYREFNQYHKSYITTDLRHIVNDIDVFVFDYISSAFFIAAATDKPIIFFDLGIRNIASEALYYIQNRTYYFDVNNIKEVDSDSLLSQISTKSPKENDLTEAFSLGDMKNSRVDVLMNYVNSIIS